MIKLDFNIAVAALLSVLVVLMLGAWLGERARRRGQEGLEDDAARDIRQCPYCRHVCVNDQHKKVMICPVCKSYFEEEAP